MRERTGLGWALQITVITSAAAVITTVLSSESVSAHPDRTNGAEFVGCTELSRRQSTSRLAL